MVVRLQKGAVCAFDEILNAVQRGLEHLLPSSPQRDHLVIVNVWFSLSIFKQLILI